MHEWIQYFPSAITVLDDKGIILNMNDKSAETFAEYGGKSLIGKSIYDVHPPYACDKIRRMYETGDSNYYTIEKNGKKKLIYQQPWKKDDKVAGMVEMSIEIPFVLPHYVR
ncbi:MAG: PAS domain-containing protein [Candidatus Cloacimonetes bacterium]|nr:PAS domain-containing protein [Candidatus Cloacimonadota bacterium]